MKFKNKTASDKNIQTQLMNVSERERRRGEKRERERDRSSAGSSNQSCFMWELTFILPLIFRWFLMLHTFLTSFLFAAMHMTWLFADFDTIISTLFMLFIITNLLFFNLTLSSKNWFVLFSLFLFLFACQCAARSNERVRIHNVNWLSHCRLITNIAAFTK